MLASVSPRRRELLGAAGIPHEVVAPPEAEPDLGQLAPTAHARVAAESKARSVARLMPGRLVLGADTVVAVGPRPADALGKPQDDRDAERMLTLLAGRTHEVITGVALVRVDSAGDEALAVRDASTRVTFRAFDSSLARRYASTGEPLDKAGAYAVQGRIATHVARLDGSWSNVVGLPLELLPDLFADLGEDLATWQDW